MGSGNVEFDVFSLCDGESAVAVVFGEGIHWLWAIREVASGAGVADQD